MQGPSTASSSRTRRTPTSERQEESTIQPPSSEEVDVPPRYDQSAPTSPTARMNPSLSRYIDDEGIRSVLGGIFQLLEYSYTPHFAEPNLGFPIKKETFPSGLSIKTPRFSLLPDVDLAPSTSETNKQTRESHRWFQQKRHIHLFGGRQRNIQVFERSSRVGTPIPSPSALRSLYHPNPLLVLRRLIMSALGD